MHSRVDSRLRGNDNYLCCFCDIVEINKLLFRKLKLPKVRRTFMSVFKWKAYLTKCVAPERLHWLNDGNPTAGLFPFGNALFDQICQKTDTRSDARS